MAESPIQERRIVTGSFPDIILVARGAHNIGFIQFESRVRTLLQKVLPSTVTTVITYILELLKKKKITISFRMCHFQLLYKQHTPTML